MEVLFVRHGQPAWYADGLGVNDPGLTDLGHEQADCFAAGLDRLEVDAIWVSPLRRAQETAAPLCARRGIDPIVIPGLEEVRALDITGLRKEEVDEHYRRVTAGLSVAEWWAGGAGTEPLTGFVERVSAGLEQALGATTREDHGVVLWDGLASVGRVVVVSHAGTSGVGIAHLLGAGQHPWAWRRFGLHHAASARLSSFQTCEARTFALRSFDDTRHLIAAQITR